MVNIPYIALLIQNNAHVHVSKTTSEVFFHTGIDSYQSKAGVELHGLTDDLIQSPSCEDIREEVLVDAFQRYRNDEPTYSQIMNSPTRINDIYEYFFALDDEECESSEENIGETMRKKFAERIEKWCIENELEYCFDEAYHSS